jgi:hypothetical protein
MKKLFTVLAMTVAFSGAVSAQSLMEVLFSNQGGQSSKAASTVSAITNVVSGLAGTVYSAPVSLNGTYNYNGIAVSATSSEGGIVANLAGSAVTSGIETKADEYLAKVGIVPGVVKFTFNSADNTFVMNVGSIPLSGTYKVGDGEKTVTLTFGKTMQYFCMTGVLESGLTGAKMLFPANKTVALLKKVAAKIGQSSSSVGAIAKLADGYDNFKVGFKLSK